jgi:hypothetical protein
MAGGLADRGALARLRDAPAVLNRELESELGKAGRDAARKAQDRIRGAGQALAGQIAATVSVTGTTRSGRVTVAIISDGRKMPPGKKNLPAYADASQARFARWRHPVHGPGKRNPDPAWVTQEWPAARGWFTGTLRGEQDTFLAAARRAVDGAAAETGRP